MVAHGRGFLNSAFWAEFSQDNVENIKIELDELGDEALKNLYPDILEVDMGETEEKKTKLKF